MCFTKERKYQTSKKIKKHNSEIGGDLKGRIKICKGSSLVWKEDIKCL